MGLIYRNLLTEGKEVEEKAPAQGTKKKLQPLPIKGIVGHCYSQEYISALELRKRQLEETVNESTGNNKPQHFTRSFTNEEQQNLFNGLIKGGFIPKNTNVSHFHFVFGSTAIPDNEIPFKPLEWIKTNSTTKGVTPNKKSLLDLLVLLEIPEIEIKNKKLINTLFKIPKGAKFKANNYTDITDHNGNLKRFESEYHNELVSIVSKSKEK